MNKFMLTDVDSDYQVVAQVELSKQLDDALGLIQVSTRISKELYTGLLDISMQESHSIQYIIRELIEKYVHEHNSVV